ncbi:nickel pincer cofactor biosynthesis protein LarB [Vulgatibacter incomptus]|uniref:Circadian phase modifier n=1 Tax=Vulgatibacter incomptus TaxID=1391653 RepID=A0A0K1PHN1_9BACT|nr:nickel pincer cofactor biosynthesis protein LarB [Vulgatibacter incomptus]AKU93048.1 Circadian phase modifier [Vulgatibacter incomptus]
MDERELRKLLEAVRSQEISTKEAVGKLRELPFKDLGYAVVDHHRQLRQGFPEVIYGEGKTAAQIAGIAEAIVERGAPLLVTRLAPEKLATVEAAIPQGTYHALSRTFMYRPKRAPKPKVRGYVAVVCAGTSDLPVAEEAAVTLAVAGHPVREIHDVGVAGIHRLLRRSEEIAGASVVVAVAGMEGALPTAVAGMVGVPVVAVPTSVGYGAALGGVTALLGMLTSCASNVAVVNIDNGFGAGFYAAMINRK